MDIFMVLRHSHLLDKNIRQDSMEVKNVTILNMRPIEFKYLLEPFFKL
jgi:hypothetical protein